mmetsp:Transcript_62044/g.134608  ORF Transcript_62044/g.134608 Transcript_62044/m.134608 type:complete len:299 (+) Transcript_62044:344-1240(+)
MCLHGHAGEDVLHEDSLCVGAHRHALAQPAFGSHVLEVTLNLLEADDNGRDDLGRDGLGDALPVDRLSLVLDSAKEEFPLVLRHLRESCIELESRDRPRHLLDAREELEVTDEFFEVQYAHADVLDVDKHGHAVTGELPHLLIDVHDDSQNHVHHQEDNPNHEGNNPCEGAEPILLGQLLPPILALHGNLEAVEERRLRRGEALHLPAEHDHTGQGKRHKRRNEDDEEVKEVHEGSRQGRGDDPEPRLPLERDKRSAHEEPMRVGRYENAVAVQAEHVIRHSPQQHGTLVRRVLLVVL